MKILILGHRGYVGSRLQHDLRDQHDVEGVDIGWFTDGPKDDYKNLSAEYVQKHDVIICVAGHSSVGTCVNGDIQGPWLNNVTNFVNLLDKIKPEQLVIYASSASVYGNTIPGMHYKEKLINFSPINNYDLTKYVLDLHAQSYINRGYNIVGLRFGTVNGGSPYIRTDVMINAMYVSAKLSGQIVVKNKQISRALLGTDDLSRAVDTIINKPKPGIYNLASFNVTVDAIATTLADKLKVNIVDQGKDGNAYDFGLDCELFEKVYDFEFKETPLSIVDGLDKWYYNSSHGRRDNYMEYTW